MVFTLLVFFNSWSVITFQHSQMARQFWGFPGGSAGAGSACKAGDPGLIPGLGRPFGEGSGNPLQHSCLGNSMDRVACRVRHFWTTNANTHPVLYHSLNIIEYSFNIIHWIIFLLLILNATLLNNKQPMHIVLFLDYI